MPWCGYWGTAGSAFWWAPPLIVFVLMGVMFFGCLRGFGCMGRRRATAYGFSDVQQKIQELQEDVEKLVRPPG